jgi:hypothetical protein
LSGDVPSSAFTFIANGNLLRSCLSRFGGGFEGGVPTEWMGEGQARAGRLFEREVERIAGLAEDSENVRDAGFRWRSSKVASVRKSVLAMLYGRYFAEGKIDLNKTVEQLGVNDVQPGG